MKQAIRETPIASRTELFRITPACLQTYHTEQQTTANKLEIDDSQFDKANSRFSASHTSLRNTVRALCTTNIK